MNIGPDGTTLCHYFEALQLRAYPDPGSALFRALRRAGIDPYGLASVPAQFNKLSGAPWTIGYGDTGPDVVPGLTIDEAEADRRFARRMRVEFEPGVDAALAAPVDQRQFDALVSIFYNAGVGALSTSTLVRLVNEGDIAGAALQFPRWNKSGGVVMKGLQRRRHAEMLVFMGGDAHSSIRAALAVYP